MRRLSLVIISALLSLVIIGCEKEGELTGEVFVVTKGGENKKLGLVTVRAYEPETIYEHIEERHQRSKDLFRDVLPDAAGKLDTLADIYSKYNEAIAKEREAWSALLNPDSQNPDVDDWASIDKFEAERELIKTREPTENKLAELVSIRRQGFYLSDLPQALDSAKTNADGEFSLPLNRGTDYILVASGQREVGDETERYHWFVKTSLEGEEEHIMLSNDNMDALAEEGYALSDTGQSMYTDLVIALAENEEVDDWSRILQILAFPGDSSVTPENESLQEARDSLLTV